MKKTIVLYQQKLFTEIPEDDIRIIKDYHPDFVCLPEYFFHPDFISYEHSLDVMKSLSIELNTILIGGTTVVYENEQMYNTSYIFNKGQKVGRYKKINLYEKELEKITPGDTYKIFEIGGIRVGVLICADVLYRDAWENMKGLNPDIIFIPTFSPFKEETIENKFKRDEDIFVTGAKLCHATIIKTCSIGTFKTTKLQGRSLAASPSGIIWRTDPANEHKKIIKYLEVEL